MFIIDGSYLYSFTSNVISERPIGILSISIIYSQGSIKMRTRLLDED